MDNKTIQKPDHSIDRMLQLAGLPIIKNSGNPTLLNEELQRMQTLAGLSPGKHKFEIFLEQKSHLTLNEILFQLNEGWKEEQKIAIDYWDNLSPQEKDAAAALAQKLKPNDLNLTKDQFDDKVVNLAPNNKLVKTPLWKRIVTGAIALIMSFNSLSGPLVTAYKNDNNFNKITAQTQQAQDKLNKANTANFNDAGNIKKATNLNPSLDDPGDGKNVLHIQYKTSGYAIKGQQRQDTKQFASNVVDIVDDGYDVEVNATSTYGHQPSDPDNENKAVDNKKLDDARANSFKAVAKEDIKKEAESRGDTVTEEGDLLKIKTEKGTHTVKITSDTAKEVGKPNKIGDVDQGTIASAEVVQGPPEKVPAIWQSFEKDTGLPNMPKDNPDDVEKATKPTGDERPTGKSDEKPTSRSDQKPTPGPTGEETPTGPTPAGEQESSQRNTQLAVLLKAIAGEVDTFKELGVPYNSRLTQATMNKAQTSKGKDYVALVTAIRKNPDYFLGKVSKLTGQDLSGREKMASIFGEGLITENTIDDLLVKVGITDDIIKSKGKTIIDYLRKVYKLSGTGTAPNQPTSTAVPKDIQNIQNSMDRNKTLDTSLGKVDRVDELTTLLVGMMQYVEDNLKKDPNNVLTTLQATKTELPKHYNPSTTTGGSNFSYSVVKEENVIPADTSRVLDLINKYPNLVRLLKTVNNRQELKALILLVISSVNPILSSAKEKVSTAITNATNILRSQKQDK